jgi:hypothetical protein
MLIHHSVLCRRPGQFGRSRDGKADIGAPAHRGLNHLFSPSISIRYFQGLYRRQSQGMLSAPSLTEAVVVEKALQWATIHRKISLPSRAEQKVIISGQPVHTTTTVQDLTFGAADEGAG